VRDRFRRRVLARAAWLGISQQQLASLVGIDESTLSRAFRADRPRQKTIERIGAALDLTADELAGDDDGPVVRPHRAITDPAGDVYAQLFRWSEARRAAETG